MRATPSGIEHSQSCICRGVRHAAFRLGEPLCARVLRFACMRHARHGLAVLVVALAGLTGCSGGPGDTANQTSQSVEGNGYVHLFSRSRFATGPILETKTEFGLEKVIGAWGVFG